MNIILALLFSLTITHASGTVAVHSPAGKMVLAENGDWHFTAKDGTSTYYCLIRGKRWAIADADCETVREAQRQPRKTSHII